MNEEELLKQAMSVPEEKANKLTTILNNTHRSRRDSESLIEELIEKRKRVAENRINFSSLTEECRRINKILDKNKKYDIEFS